MNPASFFISGPFRQPTTPKSGPSNNVPFQSESKQGSPPGAYTVSQLGTWLIGADVQIVVPSFSSNSQSPPVSGQKFFVQHRTRSTITQAVIPEPSVPWQSPMLPRSPTIAVPPLHGPPSSGHGQ